MQCTACHLEQADGIRYCEDCGAAMSGESAPAATAQVAAGRICTACGAACGPADDDFCPRCGAERPPAVDDHIEIAIGPNLAGVSDRGKVRRRNEDFLAMASGDELDVLVVCDGVSKSQQADRAAHVAATTVCAEIVKGLTPSSGTPEGSAAAGRGEAGPENRSGLADRNHPHPNPRTQVLPEYRERGPENAIRGAIRAADAKVRALPAIHSLPGDPAETTLVAAVRIGNRLTVAWLGDSRAYWVDKMRLRPLTVDHSWMNDAIASGEMTREQAATHANAHSITRTLGGPAGPDGVDEPSLAGFDLGPDLHLPGTVLLCTDGFWDFHDDDAQFAAAVTAGVANHTDAISIARALVEQACNHRGHDNTTVAVLLVGDHVAAANGGPGTSNQSASHTGTSSEPAGIGMAPIGSHEPRIESGINQ